MRQKHWSAKRDFDARGNGARGNGLTDRAPVQTNCISVCGSIGVVNRTENAEVD